MYAAIRVRGIIRQDQKVKDTISMLLLPSKYSCMFYPETEDVSGMLRKVKDFIAYGTVDKGIVKEIILKSKINGRPVEENLDDLGIKDIDELVNGIVSGKIPSRELRNKGLKLPLTLHPPRKGFKGARKGFSQGGILGNHKDKIGSLIERMI